MNIVKRLLREELFNQIKIISENKQVGLLYHSTNPTSAIKIIQTDELFGSYWGPEDNEVRGISTSRNKSWIYDGNVVQFVLDGDKLSTRYKIRPHDYWYRDYNVPDNPQTVDEDEEIIITPKGSVKEIKRYIVKVNIFGNKRHVETVIDTLTENNIPYSIIP